jgi:hypothetical protein
VAVGAGDAIDAPTNVFRFVLVIDFTAVFAGEVVIFVTIGAQGYIIRIGGDVIMAEQLAAMAASIVIIGALSAYKPAVIIYGCYLFVGY